MGSYTHYLLKALRNPGSLLLFGGLAMISLISGNPLPLIIGAAGKLGWVVSAPMIPAWKRKVDAGEEQKLRLEGENRAKDLLKKLPAEEQQRYQQLVQTAMSIRENYGRYNEVSRGFLENISARLDDMLLRYLRMQFARDNYRRHLATNDASDLEHRMGLLESEMESDSEQIKRIKGKQLQILQQRREKLVKAKADSDLLEEQTTTLEELMKLLKEQALTMKDPEEMNAQLDSLMAEVEHTEQTVTAIEASFDTQFDRELRAAEEEQRRLQAQ
ncbi:MAG: hypothetical protein C0600_05955 [Ignavibacteria bacterium]|nr:MAG: hypothetical protein C0600_05955 [Ignavibacteria bacterium]